MGMEKLIWATNIPVDQGDEDVDDDELTPMQQAVMDWFDEMLRISEEMPPEKLAELDEWEAKYVGDGTYGTGDWPGWAEFGLPIMPSRVGRERNK